MDITPHLDAIAFLGVTGTIIAGAFAAIVSRELRYYRDLAGHRRDRISELKEESYEYYDVSQNLSEKLDEARTHNTTLTEKLADADSLISDLKKDNAEKDNTITALRLGLDDAEKEAAELRKADEQSQQIINEARAANEALANTKAEEFQDYLANQPDWDAYGDSIDKKITFFEDNEAKKQKLRNTFKGA